MDSNLPYVLLGALAAALFSLYLFNKVSLVLSRKRYTHAQSYPISEKRRDEGLLTLLPKSTPLPVSDKKLNIIPITRRTSLSLSSPQSPNSPYTNTPLVHYTPSEIAAFGSFPDYASITGVPLPEAYPEFDIVTAKPRPYRPFRWSYHQTMSLTKMEPNWWLELEDTYVERMEQRLKLWKEFDQQIIQTLAGTEIACKELMEMVIQFLCARYPQYFNLNAAKTILENKILGKTFDIGSMHPLHLVFHNVPEDFAIVLKDDVTSKYTFKAGVICSSIGWDLSTKIGKELAEIHKIVPDYKEKMAMSMDRYFSKLGVNKPIQRGSWGLEIDKPLFVPPGHPDEQHRTFQNPNLKESDLYLRVDWQTLRRMPLSNAIVFNYKALFTPMSEFADEPGIPALIEKVITEGNKNIMKYKGTWHVEHVALPMLEKMKKEQVEKGIWDETEEVKTLDESPFYRGWEEKWHRQQGF